MSETVRERLQQTIGYRFQNPELLTLALTHSSYANENSHGPRTVECNERLEFLGDAVLELVTSEYLYETRRDMHEGSMSKLRASIVCEPSLGICARDINLGECLRLGHGEDMTGGRERDSILSDAFESVIGAIYLDGGPDPAREFVHRFVLGNLTESQLFKDTKTRLQEIAQQMFHCEPTYALVKEDGPAHCKEFTMSCTLDRFCEVATGHSKKQAEQECAAQMLKKLKELQ
ncbi:MAG: ribonuclease III [Lachnospiraceae bacterium]|nr:ribonuclease III [Lachnospiraceae bacterium]